MFRSALALAGLLALALATPARAAFTVYTSQSAFLAALAPNPFLDTYNDLPITTVVSPINRSGSGFSYTASAAGNFFPAGSAADVWLSTNIDRTPIVYNNFSSNTRGVGGFFFGSDLVGAFVPGQTMNITAVDGSGTFTQSITNATQTSFLGVISDGPITSFTVGITPVGPAFWVTVNDFILGAPAPTAVPAPPTLLLGLIGLGVGGVARLRRRAG